MERDEIFQDDPANRSPLALDQKTLLNDQFRVGRVLGVGGFGITYLAFDEVLEMVVAVKEYLPNDFAVRKSDGATIQPLSSADGKQDFEYGLQRFLQEARTLAKFERHPNIVRVRTFFEENGTAYLVMNFYKGRTLAEYLEARNGFIPEEEALLIMEQVVDGLGAVHEEEILHRDIDPNNVYLAEDGTVVLLDFGAARTAVGERTQSMSVVLKRGYAPHEQYHSHGDQGPWTDIYACSATLYRAVTGYKPPEAAARILDDDLASPKELVPSLSDATNEAVLKGLEVRPQNRPQSMEEFSALLPEASADAKPRWSGELSTVERENTSAGSSELQVTATHPCRLYVDGSQTATLPAGESFTVGVQPGTHRLRAVRTDQASSGNATVTASGTDVDEGGGNTRMSLDSLIWQDVVSVAADDPTTVEIDFEAASSALPPTEQPDETVLAEDPSPSAEDGVPSASAETENGAAASEGADAGTESEETDAIDGDTDISDTDVPDGTALGIVKVRVSRPARLLVDGEEEAEMESDASFEVERSPGAHEVVVEALDGSERWEETVFVEAGETQMIEVDFHRVEEASRRGGVRQYAVMSLFIILLLGGAGWWALTNESIRSTVTPVVDLPRPEVTEMVQAGQQRVYDRLGAWGIRNQAPRPRPDRVITTADSVVVDVTANDRDPNDNMLYVRSAGPVPVSVAQITVVDSTHVGVKPAETFAGVTKIPYVVADAPGDTAQTHISLRVPFSGAAQTVTEAVDRPQVVHTDAFRENGRRDVVVAALGDPSVSWVEQSPSDRGGFLDPVVLDADVDGAVDVQSGDLTGDGFPDLVSASLQSDAVTWYENEGDGSFGSPHRLHTEADGAVAVRTLDADGDGDNDVVSGALLDETVYWYENEGGGDFGDPRTVTDGIRGMETIHITDLDRDSNPDVLVVSYKDSTISWYEPEPGGSEERLFVERPPIATDVREPIAVHTADVTGNGWQDVLAGKAGSESLVLFSSETDSTAGTPQFGEPQVLSSDLRTIESIDTGDLDGDGDTDIFAASFDDERIVWFENQGDGRFSSAQPISTGVPNVLSIEVADVDGDGDVDVLGASQTEGVVRWYENHLR